MTEKYASVLEKLVSFCEDNPVTVGILSSLWLTFIYAHFLFPLLVNGEETGNLLVFLSISTTEGYSVHRWFTAMLTHVDIYHALVNSVVLLFFLAILEDKYTRRETVLFSLVGGAMTVGLFVIVYSVVVDGKTFVAGASAVWSASVAPALLYSPIHNTITVKSFRIELTSRTFFYFIFLLMLIQSIIHGFDSKTAHIGHLIGIFVGVVLGELQVEKRGSQFLSND